MENNSFSIKKKKIGLNQPTFFIADLAANHDCNFKRAKKLIYLAKKSGADAVKFQTFRADNLATSDAPKAKYQERTTDSGESQFEMLRRLELSLEMHLQLMAYCEERGILFMSSPFDEESVELLAEMETGNLRWLLSLDEKRLDDTGNVEVRCWAVTAGMLGQRKPDMSSFDPSWHHNYATLAWYTEPGAVEESRHYPAVAPEHVGLMRVLQVLAHDADARTHYLDDPEGQTFAGTFVEGGSTAIPGSARGFHAHELDGAAFLRHLAGCRAYVGSAGFEGICEAHYLGKAALAVPTKGHFEQTLNAWDAERCGVAQAGSYADLDEFWAHPPRPNSEQVLAFKRWLARAPEILVEEVERAATKHGSGLCR